MARAPRRAGRVRRPGMMIRCGDVVQCLSYRNATGFGGETPGEAAVREVAAEVEVTRRLGDHVHPASGRHLVYLACRIVVGKACIPLRSLNAIQPVAPPWALAAHAWGSSGARLWRLNRALQASLRPVGSEAATILPPTRR